MLVGFDDGDLTVRDAESGRFLAGAAVAPATAGPRRLLDRRLRPSLTRALRPARARRLRHGQPDALLGTVAWGGPVVKLDAAAREWSDSTGAGTL